MIDQDELEVIKNLIKKETIYLRHYDAQVVSVEEVVIGTTKTFRVWCLPHDLGCQTINEAIGAYPRQGKSVLRPTIGEYVELYFLKGDPDFPVFLYPVSENNGSGSLDTKTPLTDIIYQSKDTVGEIIFDQTIKTFSIGEKALFTKICNGTLGVARLTDTTLSSTVSDASFWVWVSAVSSALSSLGYPVTPIPTTLTSTINSASSKVLIS